MRRASANRDDASDTKGESGLRFTSIYKQKIQGRMNRRSLSSPFGAGRGESTIEVEDGRMVVKPLDEAKNFL